MEEWRSVLGFEGLYEVSNFGNVRSLDRTVKWKKSEMRVPGKVLAPYLRADEYCIVNLCNSGTNRQKLVHCLVAQAFLEPSLEGFTELDHIDRNRSNNHISNLRWADRSLNMRNIGLRKDNKLGERNIYEERGSFVVSSVRLEKNKYYFKTLDEARTFRLEKLGY
jgi:hypothetical protein